MSTNKNYVPILGPDIDVDSNKSNNTETTPKMDY